MFNTFDVILQQECQLNQNLPILVGVSGGPDSICLLHSLKQAGYPVVIAHLNHQLRPEADLEAEMVTQLAKDWQVPAISDKADVIGYAQHSRSSIEEAARELRYQFLFSAAVQHETQAVAVGHNADDQVETVLMHLLRGAGPAGLRGMRHRSLPNPWSNTIPLVRPLLSIWRKEIETYLEEHGLPANRDFSNLDTVYYRNRLRHDVIPYLQTLNPQFKQALWQMAELVGTDYDFISGEVQKQWDSGIARNRSRGVIEIIRAEFSRLQPSLQRELLRRGAFSLQPGLRDLDYTAIQRAIRALNIPESDNQVDLVSGLRLIVEPDRLWLVDQGAEVPLDNWPQINPNERSLRIQLDGPASPIQLDNHWELKVEMFACNPQLLTQAMTNTDPFQAWIDADQIQQPWVLRPRLPGDRIELLGMEGQHTKLSDLFINRKIHRRARANWPVLVSGETIIWIPGVQLAHTARLTGASQRAIHFSLVQK